MDKDRTWKEVDEILVALRNGCKFLDFPEDDYLSRFKMLQENKEEDKNKSQAHTSSIKSQENEDNDKKSEKRQDSPDILEIPEKVEVENEKPKDADIDKNQANSDNLVKSFSKTQVSDKSKLFTSPLDKYEVESNKSELSKQSKNSHRSKRSKQVQFQVSVENLD